MKVKKILHEPSTFNLTEALQITLARSIAPSEVFGTKIYKTKFADLFSHTSIPFIVFEKRLMLASLVGEEKKLVRSIWNAESRSRRHE
jgi:hypothetical protein